ncbi:protein SCAI isoform X1 [Amborella trichopoda]|uniref:protein SCAI isoform X1 n=1 Tax=Amborella trichopoda TaxID=13333 RepID=UPI0009BCE407|nr:protein SCAI isoform X1 [Amborella trichopoda]|eukprot:XP_020528588.1 protein SCAI isoform X1 [Amborella trichopoda]
MEERVSEKFRSLVESAEKKFARVRDLPYHGRDRCGPYFQKVFKAYMKLWKFQQENRQKLVEAGLRRAEIGEIASRIGQLYYTQYLRTSEIRFLVEACVFYEAILERYYFKGSSQDLGLAYKELRFLARFMVVCLLLNREEMVQKLVERHKSLLDECKRTLQDASFKDWKHVVQEIVRFVKADTELVTVRPLRYCVPYDSHPVLLNVANLKAWRPLKLQDALLTSYHHNEVKFSDITLDTFRMLQCLEWEPSGSFHQIQLTDSSADGVCNRPDGFGINHLKIAEAMDDAMLPPNPRKAILYRPSVTHLIAVIATICEELSPESIMLIYISASGKAERNVTSLPTASGALMNSSQPILRVPHAHDLLSKESSVTTDNHRKYGSESHASVDDKGDSVDSSGTCLWLGSRGNGGVNKLYPADILPFTRRPLFLIIDSDNSCAFKIVHGSERGESAALLLSPSGPTFSGLSSFDPTRNGSLFTFFLTAPIQAFCKLVGLSNSNLEMQDVYRKAEGILSSAFSVWEVILSKSDNLEIVWARVLPDPFLRRLIIRFIFCRTVLALYAPCGKNRYLPECQPNLPASVSPTCATSQSTLHRLASCLGVVDQFSFTCSLKGTAQITKAISEIEEVCREKGTVC